MSRKICERDRQDAFGHNNPWWSKVLERIVEPHGLIGDKFGENVGGEDLGKRAESQHRVRGRKLMRPGRRLAVSAKKDLIVANDDENHARGTRLQEQVFAKRTGRLKVGERCGRESPQEEGLEGQREQECEESALDFWVAHFLCADLMVQSRTIF